MAISKITLNGQTQMDVTQKTVTPGSMTNGTTSLKNDGTDIEGTILAWYEKADNVLDLSAFDNSSYTTNGITYAWDDDGNCTLTGTASPSASLRILYNNSSVFPTGLGAKDCFYVDFTGTEVFLEVYEYQGSSAVLLTQTYTPKILQFSAEATGLLVRLRVATNHGPGSVGEVVSPKIYTLSLEHI